MALLEEVTLTWCITQAQAVVAHGSATAANLLFLLVVRCWSENKSACLFVHGCQMAIARILDCIVWPYGLEGLWLCYAVLQHLTLAQSKERKGSNFAIWQPLLVRASAFLSGAKTKSHSQVPPRYLRRE